MITLKKRNLYFIKLIYNIFKNKDLFLRCLQELRNTDDKKLHQVIYFSIDELIFNIELNKDSYDEQEKLKIVNLLKDTLKFLVEIAEERKIPYKNSLNKFNSEDMESMVIKCKETRELLSNEIKKLDYDDLQRNYEQFPELVKCFDRNWLKKEYDKGYPYHILLWLLSDLSNSKNMIWINYIVEGINILDNKPQGKKIIIEGLKDDSNFWQFLSQLEIGLKLEMQNYTVTFEDTSIIKKPRIDILAIKNGQSLIFEIVTPDMNRDLKYLGFTLDDRDRSKSKLYEKIKQISAYVTKPQLPIIIVINRTRIHDPNIEELIYALTGIKVHKIFLDKGSGIHHNFVFERDSDFIKTIGANELSAVICYEQEINNSKVNLKGNILLNESATVKLDEITISNLKGIFI
jgi:hypothetical protein